MTIGWNDNTPIYRQLKEKVIGMMLDGALKAGDALPSVRQVAAEYQLNPITVSRAYQELVDEACVMVLTTAPFILSGGEAIGAVSDTPRWSRVQFSEERSAQPRDDAVVIAYRASAERDGGDAYAAYSTTARHRASGEVFRVVQHQQLPPITADAG